MSTLSDHMRNGDAGPTDDHADAAELADIGADVGTDGPVDDDVTCVVQDLPARLRVRAAELAATINPVNSPFTQAGLPDGGLPDPADLAVLTSKYWGRRRRTLTVSFVESTAAELRQRILGHMNAWGIGVRFALTSGVGQVRISRAGQGYWSYLGTDILLIPRDRPTMNLQGFTMATPEREYKRVVRHETGHTLGFPHEHLRRSLVGRLDVAKTIAYFRTTYGWSEQQTRSNVLTPLEESSIMGTPNADQDSIMCYQLPAQITKDGQPIRGGLDINLTDRGFARTIYPRFWPFVDQTDWDQSADVSIESALTQEHVTVG
ncbi:peptidase M12 [Skermania piniformis]|uniref:Peptidase M12 n=1 Tax=Skermania pinensis TaxID=39122 RepID=A0ABX8SBQ0_9ACTN|nr:peptidase M12 [Skermania piniformis]QXQ13875.1 peptidase M12 [Skermania piniformis]